jgi:hypothetical protein
MNVWEWLRLQWDRVTAGVCIAAGLLAMLLGYIGISGTVYPAEQLPYILSGGIFGVFLLGLGAMLWLSADVRDEWRKLDVMEGKLDALDAMLERGARPLRARRASVASPEFASSLDRRLQAGELADEHDSAADDDPTPMEAHGLATVSSGGHRRRRAPSDAVDQ